MKNLLLLLFLAFAIFAHSCDSRSKADSDSAKDNGGVVNGQGVIQFDEAVNDLGTISEGEQVMAWFTYENTGVGPLTIQNIDAGCGCTVPSWNEEPLAPGNKESIRVIFNSRGKNGSQNIRVTVYSNARNSPEELRIKATVISKP
jgi:hypothetical protein